LDWILRRCEDAVDATETPIGFIPKPEDINVEGLAIDNDTLKGLLTVDKDTWRKEAEGIEEFYKKFGDKLPKELAAELSKLKAKLN
jgi:Phosphoenolpyruvate carboxykinase (GTP)